MTRIVTSEKDYGHRPGYVRTQYELSYVSEITPELSVTVAEEQTSIAEGKDHLQGEPTRESFCQRNAILYILVNRLETKETKVVGGWDFSCD